MSLCRGYWDDGQRHVVLPRFISAGAEEWEDAFTESVVESVDVDFSFNVVERHLQSHEDTVLFILQQTDPGSVKQQLLIFVIFPLLGRHVSCISHTAPVRSQSPRICRSYAVASSDGRLWRVPSERRTCS